uniref:Uncharacterized protein n=1 Tax=viral metagenome TaxID=1070528 RepID=A0A6M3K9H9_9ZZZZ
MNEYPMYKEELVAKITEALFANYQRLSDAFDMYAGEDEMKQIIGETAKEIVGIAEEYAEE